MHRGGQGVESVACGVSVLSVLKRRGGMHRDAWAPPEGPEAPERPPGRGRARGPAVPCPLSLRWTTPLVAARTWCRDDSQAACHAVNPPPKTIPAVSVSK